jgi:hypothetical protein
MFRKVSLRVLLYILGTLTILTIITQLSEKMNRESTYRSELAVFDTARVTGMVISDLKSSNKSIELIKTGSDWKMKANGKEYRTDNQYIRSLLWEITQLKTERIAANNKNKWKEFEVTDSLALRITVKGKSKILADLLVGKFSFQPPTGGNPYDQRGKMTSFVRIADEKEVYAVNGFIRGEISPDVNRFRDKTLVKTEAGSLRKLTFQYPADSSFVFEKQGNTWSVNGIPADSAKTVQYLNSLELMSGTDFADDVPLTGQAVFKLSLEIGSSQPVEVLAYAADTINEHIITSTLNPGVQFSGKNGLTWRIFKGKSYFLK